jgi:hypothetical protein
VKRHGRDLDRQAAFRRASLRCELDRRHCPYRASNFFHQRKAAQEELAWCVENADKPLMRVGCGKSITTSESWLLLTGTGQGTRTICGGAATRVSSRPITLILLFGRRRFGARRFTPRRVWPRSCRAAYILSGLRVPEYYFVVSDDGRRLIGIDAGTRADSAKVAYEGAASVRARPSGIDNHLHYTLPLGPCWRPQILSAP